MNEPEELTARLKQTVPRARALVEKLGGDKLRETPPGGGLSPLECIVAMFKMETEYARPGIDMILNHDSPVLPSFDPVKRAEKEGYNAFHPEGMLQEWSSTRSSMIIIIEALTEEELSKTGRHPELGVVILWELLRDWTEREEMLTRFAGEKEI